MLRKIQYNIFQSQIKNVFFHVFCCGYYRIFNIVTCKLDLRYSEVTGSKIQILTADVDFIKHLFNSSFISQDVLNNPDSLK